MAARGSRTRAAQGWVLTLLALLAFLAAPAIPWLPVAETYLLLMPALGVMALLGWWHGGPAVIAVGWIAAGIAVVASSAVGGGPSGPYLRLVAGWGLLVASLFGAVSIVDPARRFFARALAAVSGAMVVGLLIAAVGSSQPRRVPTLIGAQIARRTAEATSGFRRIAAQSPEAWREITHRFGDGTAGMEELDRRLATMSASALTVFPALLAIESLAALALAWTLYHRLSRARVGAALAPLSAFRFNDHLVWGMIVGVTLFVVHTLTAFHDIGKNFLVFFGALYVLRGLAVLTFIASPGVLSGAAALWFLLLWWPPLFVFVSVALPFVIFAALGLGLGDTWLDWRSRARKII
ncbi:MAG: hypothetical protein NVS4B3_05940 [Gemmatimonadaceae bacterium]